MAATYQPQVEFDLPSGEDAAARIREAVGLAEVGEYQSWGQESGECPDDIRAAIGDALRYQYGGWVDPWALLPRRVEYEAARVRVTLVAEDEVYGEGDGPEVQDSPRQRLLATLQEYHEELHANMVAEDDLLDETKGDRATLREELALLERHGEVYQPQPTYYRQTDAEVGDDGGE